MKIIRHEKYGLPEKVLRCEEIDKPTPRDGEILIKIHATAVNDYDWCLVRGRPFLYRLMFGMFTPKNRIPGMELSGTVEDVGDHVANYTIGDAVFGDTSDFGFGTFAEYICIHEKAVIHKPKELPFEEAAAVPHAFALALQSLRDIGNIQSGQKILINGGGGGVGTFGLQIAKQHNCTVTGVDSGDKLQMMQSIGFDSVIDYRKTNFTKTGETFDLILDCKTNKSAFAYARALKPGGTYVSNGGKLTCLLGVLMWGKPISAFSSKQLRILSLKPNKGLDSFIDLYRQNAVTPQIDGPHPLEDIPKLIQYFGRGEHKGKIVIRI
ncbi:MAG: NAD(P)-dependent alcohol dehydrogenase [Salinispira sp.]